MDLAKLPIVLLPLLYVGCGLPLSAQKVAPQTEVREHEMNPRAATGSAPFTLDDRQGPEKPIVYRPTAKMSEQDRLQAANAQSSIAEKANYSGLEFNQGAWSYEQVDCPAFPRHIFLRFLRRNGAGDVSMFTASIPRGDEGRVRIIPIQMRSYSLFSPAPVNALTISAFNHIRTEENPDKTPVRDWVGVGLCYAALAGGKPHLGTLSAEPEKQAHPLASSASLQVHEDGAVSIAFSDIGEGSKPVVWQMHFARNGNLVKAAKEPSPTYDVRLDRHPTTVAAQGRLIPASPPPVMHAVPNSPAPVGKPAPSATTDGTRPPAQ